MSDISPCIGKQNRRTFHISSIIPFADQNVIFAFKILNEGHITRRRSKIS